MRRFLILGALCIVFLVPSIGGSAPLPTPAQFTALECAKVISEPSVNAIVQEIFIQKAESLFRSGKLSESFWARNKNLIFSVCDNQASYDTFVVYGKGVVFDYQMVAFLFAQSRALIVGRYISLEKQFDVHSELVRQFARQGPELDAGPLAIIEERALKLGLTKAAFDKMVSDPEFNRREQTFFLQAVNFLALHERCHVALDHGARLEEIRRRPTAEQAAAKQQLELAADRCALDLINIDEAQFDSSPISFFGVLMTVATQSIIASQPRLATDKSHPSTRNRITTASEVTLDYISKSKTPNSLQYETAIRGTAIYFDGLLAGLSGRQH